MLFGAPALKFILKSSLVRLSYKYLLPNESQSMWSCYIIICPTLYGWICNGSHAFLREVVPVEVSALDFCFLSVLVFTLWSTFLKLM